MRVRAERLRTIPFGPKATAFIELMARASTPVIVATLERCVTDPEWSDKPGRDVFEVFLRAELARRAAGGPVTGAGWFSR